MTLGNQPERSEDQFSMQLPRRSLEAADRVAQARQAMYQAKEALLAAQALLDATTAAEWGLLPSTVQVERRLIMQGAHLAYAKLIQTDKKIIRRYEDDGYSPAGDGVDQEHDEPSLHEGSDHQPDDRTGDPGTLY